MRAYYFNVLNDFTSIAIARDLLVQTIGKFPINSPEVRLAQDILLEAQTTFDSAFKEALGYSAKDAGNPPQANFGEVPPDTGATKP